MRLRLTISYHGGSFSGWQSQADGRAVQDVLEAAFHKIEGHRVVVHGSGRTDAGVHALAQCAHADVGSALPPEDWLRALNANLPAAVRIMAVRRAAPDFHARFDATGKVYRYLLRTGPVLPPLEVGRAWHVPRDLDPDAFVKAGKVFVGRHDFAAFAANRGTAVRDTRRMVRRISVTREGTLWKAAFEGEGFLYKMVRMMTGAMVRVAQGREDADALRERLKAGGPKWNYVAPAEGLYLVRVRY